MDMCTCAGMHANNCLPASLLTSTAASFAEISVSAACASAARLSQASSLGATMPPSMSRILMKSSSKLVCRDLCKLCSVIRDLSVAQ